MNATLSVVSAMGKIVILAMALCFALVAFVAILAVLYVIARPLIYAIGHKQTARDIDAAPSIRTRMKYQGRMRVRIADEQRSSIVGDGAWPPRRAI